MKKIQMAEINSMKKMQIRCHKFIWSKAKVEIRIHEAKTPASKLQRPVTYKREV